MVKKIALPVMVAVLALIIAVPGPAGASVSGAATFVCQVKLPIWPAVGTPGPPVDCNGHALGYIQGKTTNNKKYRAAAASTNNFVGHANKYSETCTFGEPLNGKADGTTTITKIARLTPLGGTGVGTNSFVWTRIGATAVINLTNGLVTFSDGTKAIGTKGTAVAAFSPLGAPGSCSSPSFNGNYIVVGVANFS